jgi:hypothetical protein
MNQTDSRIRKLNEIYCWTRHYLTMTYCSTVKKIRFKWTKEQQSRVPVLPILIANSFVLTRSSRNDTFPLRRRTQKIWTKNLCHVLISPVHITNRVTAYRQGGLPYIPLPVINAIMKSRRKTIFDIQYTELLILSSKCVNSPCTRICSTEN